MGAFLDKPNTHKTNETGSGNGLRYGLASMQGWRVEMEDAHCAVTQLSGHLSNWSFFAVFDGHAGARVSVVCAKMLLDTISKTKEFARIDPDVAPSLDEIRVGIRDGFLSLDAQIRSDHEVTSGQDKSGSTAVCVLISPDHIFFANCGDSRAILINNGQVKFSTEDHKPVNPVERDRITKAGGSVMIQRVNGSLAVSRSLGDYDYKKKEDMGPTEQLVSPEPEVTVFDRDPENDQAIVLACDGIWDVMTNDELNAFVQHRLQVHNDLSVICNEVVDTCLYKGSRDNMSTVIVTFPNAPQVDDSITQLDKALDAKLTKMTKDYLKDANPNEVELSQLVAHINSSHITDYPPGGLSTKRYIIDALYHEFTIENQPGGGEGAAASGDDDEDKDIEMDKGQNVDDKTNLISNDDAENNKNLNGQNPTV